MLNLPKLDGHVIHFWNELHAILMLPLLEGHIIHFWNELHAMLNLSLLECSKHPLIWNVCSYPLHYRERKWYISSKNGCFVTAAATSSHFGCFVAMTNHPFLDADYTYLFIRAGFGLSHYCIRSVCTCEVRTQTLAVPPEPEYLCQVTGGIPGYQASVCGAIH